MRGRLDARRTLKSLVADLRLNYCLRFYDRQFITRNRENKDVIVRFERLLHDYFRSDEMVEQGLPSVRFFADKLSLSANYFGDLIKKECGKSAQEYIQSYIIETAKERLCDTSKSVSEVAYGMGFQYPQHFSRMFKKSVGVTPNEYRRQN